MVRGFHKEKRLAAHVLVEPLELVLSSVWGEASVLGFDILKSLICVMPDVNDRLSLVSDDKENFGTF